MTKTELANKLLDIHYRLYASVLRQDEAASLLEAANKLADEPTEITGEERCPICRGQLHTGLDSLVGVGVANDMIQFAHARCAERTDEPTEVRVHRFIHGFVEGVCARCGVPESRHPENQR